MLDLIQLPIFVVYARQKNDATKSTFIFQTIHLLLHVYGAYKRMYRRRTFVLFYKMSKKIDLKTASTHYKLTLNTYPFVLVACHKITGWFSFLSKAKNSLTFGWTFKVGLSPSNKICVICFIESLLKMMKNTFYFILKAIFVLKIFRFLSWLFDHVEKTAWLER